MRDISSGLAARYLHSAGCLSYCPEESLSCFLSGEMSLNPTFFPCIAKMFFLCCLICFLDHLEREHTHTHTKKGNLCKLKQRPQYGSCKEKQLCGSKQYTNPSGLNTMYCFQISMSIGGTTASQKARAFQKTVCFCFMHIHWRQTRKKETEANVD